MSLPSLKIDEIYLEQKLSGFKLFEIRHNDRGYQKGDIVVYTEYGFNHVDTRKHFFEITYVSNYMQPQNQVVFGERYLRTELPYKPEQE